MADIFDELNEDLRAERARALARRYGAWAGAVLLVVLLLIGAWQGWEWQQRRLNAAAGAAFATAMQQADALPSGPSPTRLTIAAQFADIARTAPAGYRTLARLREAALRADAGETQAALGLWDAVSKDDAADRLLRDEASLLWAQHSVDGGDPAAIAARTAPLEDAKNPWRPMAMEVDALVALRLDDHDKAARLFRAVLADPLSADGVRGRASAMLTLMGMPPVDARG